MPSYLSFTLPIQTPTFGGLLALGASEGKAGWRACDFVAPGPLLEWRVPASGQLHGFAGSSWGFATSSPFGAPFGLAYLAHLGILSNALWGGLPGSMAGSGCSSLAALSHLRLRRTVGWPPTALAAAGPPKL